MRNLGLITFAIPPINSTVCSGISGLFTSSVAGAAISYLWSNGASTPNLNTSIAGTYIVTATGACNSIFASASLVVNPLPQIVTQPLAIATVCSGVVQAYTVSASGANLSYLWSNGLSTTNTMSISVAGTNYMVTVTGLCGSPQVSNAASLVVNPLPQIVTQPLANATVCSGISQSLTVSATGMNLSYAWSNGANTALISTSLSGTYMVTVSSSFCNSVSNVARLANHPTTQIVFQPQSASFTAGNFALLSISATGTNLSYLWSNGETASAFTTTVVGTYTVTVSGTCGVVVSETATVTKSANSYIFVPTAIDMSVGDTVSLDVKTQMVAPLVYTISDNSIAQIAGARLVALKAGSAIVTVSQPATPTSEALPAVDISLIVSAIPSRNFDIIGSRLVPVGVIIIYSQPSVAGFIYSWSFSGTGYMVIPGTENSPNFQIIFLSNATAGEIISIVKDKNQNIVSNKSLRVNTLSNEEAEITKNLSKIDCPAEVTDCKNAYITSVKIGSLLNENSGCSRAGFGDFRVGRKLDTLSMGDSYDLKLEAVAQAGKSSFFAIWIDYNNNGKFTDQGENLDATFESSTSYEKKNIIIPNQEAYEGVRTLRVSMRADAAISQLDPCAKAGGSGETEDYAVYIRKPDELEGANAVTPNNDGKNDNFIIRGINPKLVNKLMILDRFGAQVFETENYQNTWQGTNQNNEPLKDGTYYYVFSNGTKEQKNEFKEIRGFLEVKRK